MLTTENYINSLDFLIEEFKFTFNRVSLPGDFEVIQYLSVNRRVDLVFDKNQHLRRTYILNTEKYVPKYKEIDLCYTLEMLDLITNTVDRNHKQYFGNNRQDGIIELSDEQIIKDLIDILLDNKKVILGEIWPDKKLIDESYTKKMGYQIIAGWQPDTQLMRIKENLKFLLDNNYVIVYDDDTSPEYDSFSWEKCLKYENIESKDCIEILVDYRGQCDYMRFSSNGVNSDYMQTDFEEIKRKINTTPNTRYSQ
jgi:ribulose bisphosphate carboxylase small subunit